MTDTEIANKAEQEDIKKNSQNKFLFFATQDAYNEAESIDAVPSTSIVFVGDTHKIYTHGIEFGSMGSSNDAITFDVKYAVNNSTTAHPAESAFTTDIQTAVNGQTLWVKVSVYINGKNTGVSYIPLKSGSNGATGSAGTIYPAPFIASGTTYSYYYEDPDVATTITTDPGYWYYWDPTANDGKGAYVKSAKATGNSSTGEQGDTGAILRPVGYISDVDVDYVFNDGTTEESDGLYYIDLVYSTNESTSESHTYKCTDKTAANTAWKNNHDDVVAALNENSSSQVSLYGFISATEYKFIAADVLSTSKLATDVATIQKAYVNEATVKKLIADSATIGSITTHQIYNAFNGSNGACIKFGKEDDSMTIQTNKLSVVDLDGESLFYLDKANKAVYKGQMYREGEFVKLPAYFPGQYVEGSTTSYLYPKDNVYITGFSDTTNPKSLLMLPNPADCSNREITLYLGKNFGTTNNITIASYAEQGSNWYLDKGTDGTYGWAGTGDGELYSESFTDIGRIDNSDSYYGISINARGASEDSSYPYIKLQSVTYNDNSYWLVTDASSYVTVNDSEYTFKFVGSDDINIG